MSGSMTELMIRLLKRPRLTVSGLMLVVAVVTVARGGGIWGVKRTRRARDYISRATVYLTKARGAGTSSPQQVGVASCL